MSVYKLIPVFACFILSTTGAIAGGGDDNPFGARSAGMANASVMLSDIWSISHNQAGLASLKNMSVGFHYENRFLVNELSLKAGTFILPTKTGVFGLSISQFGYSKYNESKIGLAFAKSLGEVFSAGIQFDYINTYFSEYYGNKGTAVVEIGVRAVPKENFYIGAHIYNPTRSKIAAYHDERIPTIMRLGLGYNFSRKVLVTAETEKDIENDPVFKAGIEYNFMEHLFIRTGVASNPEKATFGIGYEIKGLKADLAFSTHPQLGLTPHFSLLWEFNKQEKKESLL
ncbi:MAG: hypothetical protein HY958_13685 [Bacteroidia bacterium]|nr:hypothetical protein [Bacteroidia bacterium]